MSASQLQLLLMLLEKGNSDIRACMMKLLDNSSKTLENYMGGILEYVQQLPIEEVSVEFIQLIYEVDRLAPSSFPHLKPSYELLWSQFCHADKQKKISKQCAAKACSSFINLMRFSDDLSLRFSYVLRCIENIKKNVCFYPSVDALKQMLELYPKASCSAQNNQQTQEDIIRKICAEHNIIEFWMENINLFKKKYQQIIIQAPGPEKEATKKRYLEKLQRRIDFLNLVYKIMESDQTFLSIKLLDQLWQALFANSLVEEEKDIMFKWLIQLGKLQKEQIDFFSEKINSNQTAILNISLIGFSCIKQLFFLINQKNLSETVLSNPAGFYYVSEQEQQQKQEQLIREETKRKNTNIKMPGIQLKQLPQSTDVANASTQQYHNYEAPRPTDSKVVYVTTDPNKLEGIKMIWRLVKQAEKKEVA